MSSGRVLGLDLGEARIGVAISDDDRRVAVPFGTVRTGAPADVKAIAAIVREQGVRARLPSTRARSRGFFGKRSAFPCRSRTSACRPLRPNGGSRPQASEAATAAASWIRRRRR